MDNVQFRHWQHGDDEAILRGFREAFGCDRSLDEWQWKYGKDNERAYSMVAIDDTGELIAYYGGLLGTMQIDGIEYPAVQPMDVFRVKRAGTADQMVFSKLTQTCIASAIADRAMTVGYGFPGLRHLEIGLDRLGYDAPVQVPYLSRTVGRRSFSLPGRFRIDTTFEQHLVDDLWNRARDRYPVALLRDGATLRHRFVDHPVHSYEFRTVRTGGTAHAWAALARTGDTVHWADLLWDGESPSSLRALERAVRDTARRGGATKLEMWLNGDPAATQVLLDAGWESMPNPLDLAITSIAIDPTIDSKSAARRMYVTMGDGDLV